MSHVGGNGGMISIHTSALSEPGCGFGELTTKEMQQKKQKNKIKQTNTNSELHNNPSKDI